MSFGECSGRWAGSGTALRLGDRADHLVELRLAGGLDQDDVPGGEAPAQPVDRFRVVGQTYAWTSPAKTRLTFEATDEASGVAAIEYRVNGGEWKTYSNSIRVRPYDVIEARATDHAGNTSDVLTVQRRR
jgi:hypothetical protein